MSQPGQDMGTSWRTGTMDNELASVRQLSTKNIQGVVDSPEASLSPEIVRRLGQGTMGMIGP